MPSFQIAVIDRASVQRSFAYCEEVARNHYENFPVASLLLPKEKRPYIAAIYAFARAADDFADEGSLTQAERLRKLDDWQEQLDSCFEGYADNPVFVALAETASRLELSKQPFADLITAFRMDVTTTRFATFGSLLEYCRCSANPVGRLVLEVFGNATERNVMHSDFICTALQLANFWQDVSVDWAKGRLYVPLEDCERFGYVEEDFAGRTFDERFRQLMQFEVGRTRELFVRGKALCSEVSGPLRFELTLTWRGGMAILDKIEQRNFDVLSYRPALTIGDKASIAVKSLFAGTA